MNNITREMLEYRNSWINLTPDYIDAHWDMKLYNILPYKRFLTLLRTRSLYFSNILTAWKDEPYELFYFKPHYFMHAIPMNVEDVSSRYYAQCWSTERDSNAMWRIYSGKNYDGVRIATTLGEIIQLLYPVRNINQLPYIGFMQYEWKKDIQAWLSSHSNLSLHDWQNAARDSLFMKRKNFRYENEFRILLSAPTVINNQPNPWSDYQTLQIDINAFIKEITFSPFIDDVTKGKHYRTTTRYLNGNISVNQSKLNMDDISGRSINIV